MPPRIWLMMRRIASNAIRSARSRSPLRWALESVRSPDGLPDEAEEADVSVLLFRPLSSTSSSWGKPTRCVTQFQHRALMVDLEERRRKSVLARLWQELFFVSGSS